MKRHERRLLRIIGDLQEAERANIATADHIVGLACHVESQGHLDYGAALRILADAYLAVDREHTRATVKLIRAAQEAHGL